MNQINFISKCVFTLAMICSLNVSAQLTPGERLAIQINRTAVTPLALSDVLTQNFYQTHEECHQYGMVQVPYTETEYYTETVAYTVDIPYTETVAYTENIPYTEWVTDYTTEKQCHSVSSTQQQCHTEQECHLVPGPSSGKVCQKVEECGVNAVGAKICKVREVCTDGGSSGPVQQCQNKQVCQNVLVPNEVCQNVQVPYQHEVTKYRQETRYREETRYRQETQYRDETRTRLVTKYRDEQQCIDSATVKVYDHQARYNLAVYLPQNAPLNTSEVETLNLRLISSSESQPQVRLESVKTVYTYRIKQQSFAKGILSVQLEVYDPTALLQQADIAELKKATNLGLSSIGRGIDSALIINDLTKDFVDIDTNYSIYLDLVKPDGTSKPLNMKAYARSNIKSAAMTVKMSDIIGYAQVSKTALVAGNVIEVSISAKRTGAKSILGGTSVKAERSFKVTIQ